MKNIRLTTPVQHSEKNPAVELDPANLERWLRELSRDDIIETVCKLDATISAFNEVKVPATNRLKLLEIYFSGFHKLLQGYDEMRIAQLRLPAKQKQQLSNDIMWLYIKLSHGYKIIVKDYAGDSNSVKQSKYLLLSAFRALELTVISLIYAYRFGLETPPLTYLEMHQLYAFAEHYELLDKPVTAASGYAKTPTIASFYALAQVFVSIEPRQYEPYTLEVLFLALQPFSFQCSITRSFEPGENSLIYKINLSENQPPLILAAKEISGVSEGTRYLDIGNFMAGITVWLDENKDNSNTLLIEQELELFPVLITRLKVKQNEKNSQLPKNQGTSLENDCMKLIIGLGSLESLLIMKSVDLNLKLNYKMSEWTVQSESSTGCELASHIDVLGEELSLGDLVAIVQSNNEDESVSLLKIAVLCGLQQSEQGVLVVRLEYITGAAHPLTYIVISGEGQAIDTTRSNGVYLVDDMEGGDQSLMIVNRKHYKESQQFLVKTREKVYTLKATKLVRQTLRYSFFHYTILQEEGKNSSAGNPIIHLAV
ncbi:MAG: hypothetical protein PVF82_14330 [Gammaproteobacteria bacterium]